MMVIICSRKTLELIDEVLISIELHCNEKSQNLIVVLIYCTYVWSYDNYDTYKLLLFDITYIYMYVCDMFLGFSYWNVHDKK